MQRAKIVRDHLRVVENALREWDPIGVVVSETSPPGEYDTYAPLVLKELQSGANVERLTQHLANLAWEIGLSAGVEHDRKTAERLISWWRTEEEKGNAA